MRIQDVGAGAPNLRADVSDAYCAKYGRGSSERMICDDAAATTLRLLKD